MATKYTITLSDGVTQFDVYELEQNGPGGSSTPRIIQVVDLTGGAGTNFFELNDDLTYRFVAGFTFTVSNSGGNDGTYTVAPAGSTYSGVSGRTSIPVVEAIATSGLPYGSISYSIPSAEEATSLLLNGRGTINYGAVHTANAVHHLENFANTTAPANPITGQLWFDTAANQLKVFGGATFEPTAVNLDAYAQESPVNVAPIASGVDSLAMGDGAEARGEWTIGIGNTGKALEGQTISIGVGSQAGQNAGLNNELGAIAIGSYSKAYELGDISIGSNSISGQVGQSINNGAIAIGNGSTSIKLYSIALGASSSSAGTYSISSGYLASARESYTIAIGASSQAGQTNEGITEQHAISIGTSSRAYELDSISIGRDSRAGINASSAEPSCIAIGTSAISEGYHSVSMGNGANSNATRSVSIGPSALSKESNSISIGYNSQSGQTNGGTAEDAAISIGAGAKAYEAGGITIGQSSITGKNGTTADPYGIAIGFTCEAIEKDAIGIGSYVDAKGTESIAIGYVADAREWKNIAIGSGSRTGYLDGATVRNNAIAIGTNAYGNEDSSIAIGNLAVSGVYSGSGAPNAIALGRETTATSNGAISVGYQTRGAGTTSLAIGYSATAYENENITLGSYAVAGQTLGGTTEQWAIAIGSTSVAHEQGCISLGYQAITGVTGTSVDPNGIAIGAGTQATGANAVSIGQAVQNANDNEVHIGTSNVNKMVLNSTGTLTLPGEILSTNAFHANVGATVDPTATDDSSSGYTVGSRWYNTTADTEWVCLDATATAAVWVETTGGGGGSLTMADDTTTNAEYYPAFATITSGAWTNSYVSSTKLTYNPSLGALTAVDFISTSDERLKENISPIEEPMDIVNQLEGHSFTWKETGKESYGFIAQEIEKVLPEVVHTDSKGMKSVNYIATIGILLEAVKQLNKRVEELESK